MADDALNKNTIFAERGGIEKTPIRNDNFGFTLGGPVRLPGYNGRNKTHFFVNVDYTRIRSGTIAGFGNTTPIDAFKAGNFGALLTGNQIGTTRWDGRSCVADLRSADDADGGNTVRDPFPGNRHSATRLSAVASRIVPLMVGPDREGLANNVAGIGTGDQTWELDARNIMFRVDQNFTPDFKSSTSFYWNRRPSVRNCEGVDGATTSSIPRRSRPRTPITTVAGSSSASPRTMRTSSSTGSSATTCWSTPRSRGTAGSWGAITCRQGRTGRAAVAGNRQSDRRYLAQDAGRPRCDSTAAASPTRPSGSRMAAVRLREERSLAVLERRHVRGRHTIKGDSSSAITTSRPAAGAEGPWRATSTSTASAPAGRRDREQPDPDRRSIRVLPAGTGARVESDHPGVPYLPGDDTGVFVNDEFKVSDKLTLTAGLRFDYQSARTEAADQHRPSARRRRTPEREEFRAR